MPAAKRQTVAYLQATLGMSERQVEQPKVPAMRSIVGMAVEGGAVVGADRTSMRYWSCRADNGDLRSRLCELVQQRRRFSYRRLHILLRRDGITINRKKTQRLYREEGLTVRRRKRRRRAVGHGRPHRYWHFPTSAGASTSSTTNSSLTGGSACSTSLTT